jgi:hypothetical protein
MNNNARQDPIRPIDPRQWIAQTNAVLMRRRSSLSPPPPAAASSTLSSSPSNSPHHHSGIQSKFYIFIFWNNVSSFFWSNRISL